VLPKRQFVPPERSHRRNRFLRYCPHSDNQITNRLKIFVLAEEFRADLPPTHQRCGTKEWAIDAIFGSDGIALLRLQRSVTKTTEEFFADRAFFEVINGS
jgi:hypothetical protein